jgi:hypothetical protein
MSIASLYPSINPSLLLDFANVKRLDPRITFTRTTTATYYDGVTTAKAEENLFLYSQQMDNASVWATNGITVTADNASAPDGTTTAELLTATSGTSGKLIQNGTLSPASSTAYTFSFFIKAGTHNFIQFMNANDAQAYANFNASTGALGNYGSNTTATITSVGNSWYRCVLTFSSAATLNSSFRWYMVASNTAAWASSLAAAGTETMYIWGAQAEQRSSATAYTATTTQAITNYIPVLQTAAAGQARFDHNPTTGESLGLLIEEARTNVCLYSEDFSDAGWTKTSVTISSNQAIAPNGSLTADKLVPSSTGAQRSVYRAFTTSGSTSTVSVYLKYGGYQWTWVECYLGRVWFDVLNGVKGAESGATGTITAVGNGWYRCTVTETTPAGGYVTVGPSSANSSQTVTVATNDVFSGVFLWGAQAEVGASFATSYIPTVASSVTRNADAASMTGTNFSSWFNNGEGTVYWDRRRTNTSASPEISIYNSTVASAFYNGSIAYIGTASNGTIRGDSVANGVTQASVTTGTGLTGTGSVKTAYAYKANDFAGSSNGQSVGTDTSGILQTGVDTLAFFTSGLNGFQHLGKFAYYPIRVTNAQLQSLTV